MVVFLTEETIIVSIETQCNVFNKNKQLEYKIADCILVRWE
jgi:hypothetical protein